MQQALALGKPLDDRGSFLVFDSGHIASHGNGYTYQVLWFSTGMDMPVARPLGTVLRFVVFKLRMGITFTNSPYDWSDSRPLTTWLGPDVSAAAALVVTLGSPAHGHRRDNTPSAISAGEKEGSRQ